MTKVQAIKVFFQRADRFAPDGGRPVDMKELQALGKAGMEELAPLCAAALGVEIVAVS